MRISAPSDSALWADFSLFYGAAEVAKLVDALDLGSSAARRESSSLSFRTSIYDGSAILVAASCTGFGDQN